MEIRTTVVESRERGYQMASQEKRLSCKRNKQFWSEKSTSTEEASVNSHLSFLLLHLHPQQELEEGGRTRKKGEWCHAQRNPFVTPFVACLALEGGVQERGDDAVLSLHLHLLSRVSLTLMGKTNFPPFALLNTNPLLLICTVQRMYLSHEDMKDMTGETDGRYKCEKVPFPQTWVHVHSRKKFSGHPSFAILAAQARVQKSIAEGRRGKSEKRSPSSDQPTDLKISLFDSLSGA